MVTNQREPCLNRQVASARPVACRCWAQNNLAEHSLSKLSLFRRHGAQAAAFARPLLHPSKIFRSVRSSEHNPIAVQSSAFQSSARSAPESQESAQCALQRCAEEFTPPCAHSHGKKPVRGVPAWSTPWSLQTANGYVQTDATCGYKRCCRQKA